MSVKKPLSPWAAFPDIQAESGAWRQGDAEHWWTSYWLPYWQSLNYQQQQEIINHPDTPADWQEKLKYFLKPKI